MCLEYLFITFKYIWVANQYGCQKISLLQIFFVRSSPVLVLLAVLAIQEFLFLILSILKKFVYSEVTLLSTLWLLTKNACSKKLVGFGKLASYLLFNLSNVSAFVVESTRPFDDFILALNEPRRNPSWAINSVYICISC